MMNGMETEQRTSAEGQGTCYLGQRIHLIGISGAGMRALGQMLLDRGAILSGSDSGGNGIAERLREQGATVYTSQRPENLPDECDLVVYSAAIDEQNPELLAGRQSGAEVVKYSQMLGRLMAEKVGLAVAGTHGKSTTAAMVSHVLKQAGKDPSFIIGATVDQLGGPSGVGKGRHFVAEACEFDCSFLNLHPQYAAILNIEEDHLDCYRDLEAIIEAFRAFVAGTAAGGVLVVNGEDRNALQSARDARCDVETFGLSDSCCWRGLRLQSDRGRVRMRVQKAKREFCELLVPLPGMHNAYNALAAVALLHHAGLEAESIARYLATFSGARRRMMLKAQQGGITVVDDYAHHPTEIQATLRALYDFHQPKRTLCIFQPHQHSRTRFMLKDFAQSFALADEVILPDIYFVRDSEKEKDYISSEDLVAQIRLRGGTAFYLKTFQGIVEHLRRILRPGDMVVTMGAGNIWEVADEIVCRLGKDR